MRSKKLSYLVCSNRSESLKNTVFCDVDWNVMSFTRQNHSNKPKRIDKPNSLTKMIEIAKKLSKVIPFVRGDLYNIVDKTYFGELTFYSNVGFKGFNPIEYDEILGNKLILPSKN